MIECQKCRGRSTLFLCPLCITELRRQFLRLPTFLDYLWDASVGNTKMGVNSGRYSGTRGETVHYNPRATDLLAEIGSTIGQWAIELARSGGYVISPPVSWHRPISEYTHTTADYAMFLAAHANELAKDPDVGELVAAIAKYIRRGMELVDRRPPPQFCGPCPTNVTDHSKCTDCGHREHACATRLMARRGALEVRCGACGVTHRVEALVNHLLARSDEYRCTIPEIHRVLRMLGTPVALKTLYNWANPKVGKLKPAGYLRSDNRRIGISRESPEDTPVYRVADARNAKARSPGRGKYERTQQIRDKTSKSVKTEGRKQK